MGGSVRGSHAWRQTTGYRETLCVQQCGFVTRTPPWLTWTAAERTSPPRFYMASRFSSWVVVTCFRLASRIGRPSSYKWPRHSETGLCVFIQWEKNTHTVFLVGFYWNSPFPVPLLSYVWKSALLFCWQVHICTTGLIVTPPPSSPVTTATVFTFPSEASYTTIPVVGEVFHKYKTSTHNTWTLWSHFFFLLQTLS